MASVRRTADMPYSAREMFDLVNDIESYPLFLSWCSGARITYRDLDTIEASLDVGIAGISKTFSTRNELTPPNLMTVKLVAGPFKQLDGVWTFDVLTERSCRVSLALDFSVQASPLSMVFNTMFEEVSRSQMSAFRERADQVYGSRS